jgi:threonine/homoserine/homoserine lactone efflux protein
VPFLLAGASITMFYGLFGRLKRYMGIIEIVSGVLLIVLGVLIMLNYLTVIAGALLRWFPFLNELG